VRHALALTRSTLEEARRSVLDLRAAPLEGRTLAGALRVLGEEFRETASRTLDIDVTCDDTEPRSLPPAVEIGLYRIAREALTNVARHANASRATVRLERTEDGVRMRIADDGTGFDPSRVPPGRFGLVGATERARLLGGSLHVESAPGAGTAIEVRVPIRTGTAAGTDTVALA
jgi:two-component system NarL family sensor kinase